jgi:hypothetical protein
MNTIKKYIWLIAIVMVFMSSCQDKEDVYDTGEYRYYLTIQTVNTQVRLSMTDDAEDENPAYDRLSRTIYHMKQAVVESDSLQGDTRAKEAALFTTLDSLYRNYAEMNPEQRGRVICYVKLIRSRMNSDGAVRDATTLKYYQFWYEDYYPNHSDGGGDNGGNEYLAPPDSLEAVDLGLTVLWANCNLGAKQPRDYGAHVAWGEPTGMLWSGAGVGWNDNGYTWNTSNYGGNNPPADIAETSLDIVAQNWGDGWHVPSYSEAKELCEQCQWKLQTYGDIKWYEVIGPNGNSIIMPLPGIYGDDIYATYRFQRGPLGVNERGYYWTSSSCPTPSSAEERGYGVNDGVVTAWSFWFNSTNGDDITPVFVDYVRAYHMSIRPVLNK